MKFTNEEIANYYDTTQNHYEKWWNLKDGLALHYGVWDKSTKNFTEALLNTNKVLMELCEIKETDFVLDAGCGVGGSSFYIHQNSGAKVVGITLSQSQLTYASKLAKEKKVDDKVSFAIMDYCNTSFESNSFDVVWACESVSSAVDKVEFIKEAFRVLKKGGRLILSDCFITSNKPNDPNKWIYKWGQTWGVSNLVTVNFFETNLKETGFSSVNSLDYTEKVRKTAFRMYLASIFGFLPSELYNFFNPKVSRFAKTHYKSGYYQYKALQEKLWDYNIVFAVK